MEQKQSTTYHCGYCNKYYLRKHAALNHEKYCSKNPINRHSCFDCKHLEMVDICFDIDIFGDNARSFKSFICNKKDKLPIYSFKAEKSTSFSKMLIDMVESDTSKEYREPQRMPISCNLLETKYL